jgi:hypothetical protein
VVLENALKDKEQLCTDLENEIVEWDILCVKLENEAILLSV